MPFIRLHKTNDRWEAGAIPSPEPIGRVGKLMGDLDRAGVLLDGAGLRSSSLGARLEFSGPKRKVTPGPLKTAGLALAGFVILRAASLDEALQCASRFQQALPEAQIDVRPLS